MLLITWNTNRRRHAAPQQARVLLERSPDIVALQEVTVRTAALLIPRLTAGGLSQVAFSLEEEEQPHLARGPRAYGVLLATRFQLAHDPTIDLPVPWREKTLSRVIQCPEGDFEVHTAHVPPGSSNLWVKIEVLEGIFRGLNGRSQRPRIFCGDLNTPQSETASGNVVTWAQRLSVSGRVVLRRRIRGGPGDRWDAAERAILTGLGQSRMTDVFRSFHGYRSSPVSWVLRRKEKAIGRRFDHIFASSEFQVARCSYLHEWRELGYSDHSALEAELELPPSARTRTG